MIAYCDFSLSRNYIQTQCIDYVGVANTQPAQIAIFKFAIYLEKPETQLFYYAIKTQPTVCIIKLYITLLYTQTSSCRYNTYLNLLYIWQLPLATSSPSLYTLPFSRPAPLHSTPLPPSLPSSLLPSLPPSIPHL